jgi:hypothetical protein
MLEPLRTSPILNLAVQVGAVLLLFEVELSQLLSMGGLALLVMLATF